MPEAKEEKDRLQLKVYVTHEAKARLVKLAEDKQATMSAVVENLIRDAA